MKIVHDNIWCTVDGTVEELNLLWRELVVWDSSATHSWAYQSKRWDGYIRLFDLTKRRFRTGLLQRVSKLLHGNDIKFTVEDISKSAPANIQHKLNLGSLVPKHYQLLMADSANANTHGLIVSPTGSGKSVGIALTIERLKRNTVVIVTDIVLLDQMHTNLSKYFDQAIGVIGDGQFDLQSITVCTFQSLTKILKTKSTRHAALMQYISSVGAVVADEAHLSGDINSIAYVLQSFQWTDRFMGFSATPYAYEDDKESDENPIMEQHFGRVILDLRQVDFIQAGIKCPLLVSIYNREPVNEEYKAHWKTMMRKRVPDSAKNYREALETEILNNHEHHKFIAGLVMGRVAQRKSVFVYAPHKLEFLSRLASMLPGAATITGATPRKERREIYDSIRNKTQFILLSDVGTTGLDIPNLDVIILAGDTVDVRQIKGRVERAAPGKKYGELIDINIKCSFMAKHGKVRRAQYVDDNNTIEEHTAYSEDS